MNRHAAGDPGKANELESLLSGFEVKPTTSKAPPRCPPAYTGTICQRSVRLLDRGPARWALAKSLAGPATTAVRFDGPERDTFSCSGPEVILPHRWMCRFQTDCQRAA